MICNLRGLAIYASGTAHLARTTRIGVFRLLTEQVGHRTVQGERRSLVVHTAAEVALRIDLVEGRRTAAGVEDIVGLVEVLHTGREAGRRTAAGVEERRMQAVGRTAAVVVGRHTEVAVGVRRNFA
jgi:hypothetical protein